MVVVAVCDDYHILHLPSLVYRLLPVHVDRNGLNELPQTLHGNPRTPRMPSTPGINEHNSIRRIVHERIDIWRFAVNIVGLIDEERRCVQTICDESRGPRCLPSNGRQTRGESRETG